MEDLRPHLAAAAALTVPLRLGGGTRLKIVEGMAMTKAIVSTTLGAEGIEARPERDLLVADEPDAFARALVRLLDDPGLAGRIGAAARRLAVEQYAWSRSAATLGASSSSCSKDGRRPAAAFGEGPGEHRGDSAEASPEAGADPAPRPAGGHLAGLDGVAVWRTLLVMALHFVGDSTAYRWDGGW